MTHDLKNDFSRKQWKGCCGKGCKECEIAQAYTGAHGRHAGLVRINEDRKAVLAAKSRKKSRKKSKKGAKKTRKGRGKS